MSRAQLASERIGTMTHVRDIMTRNVLTLAPDVSLDDVAWGLTLKGFTGAPVTDGDGRLLGVLSKSDLADAERTQGDLAVTRVEDAMTPVLYAALESDSVQFAVARMVRTGSHRLIVMNDAGKLVGIVTPMDVLRAMTDGRLTSSDLDGL